MTDEIEQLADMMENISNDTSVPRNIRKAVGDARDVIIKQGEKPEVKFTSAIYTLDEVLNDINMPFHTRTELMSIISELERLKESLK